MFTLGLELPPFAIGILVVLFLIVSVILMLVILIQKPQGGGLAGAFGSGAGSGQTAFGAKTGDALTIATISMFVIWTLFSVGLNFALTPAKADDTPVAKSQDTTQNTPEGAGTPATGGATPAPADGTKPAEGTTPAPAPAGSEPKPVEPKPADGVTPAPVEKPAETPTTTPPATTPPVTPPVTPPATPPAGGTPPLR